MPRHKVVYDKDVKETPEWKALYSKWRQIKKCSHSKEFSRCQDFYDWAMANGFEIVAKLELLDDSKPYSPDNCRWKPPEAKKTFYTEEEKRWIAKWNKTVNAIRRHYGMKPLL